MALKSGWFFFDISKAFDKVWHKGLIFKLQAAGIDGKVLSFLQETDGWLKFNPSKPKSLLISRKRVKAVHPDLSMSDVVIPSVQSHKHLCIHLSCDGNWDQQVQCTVEKAWKRIGVLRRLRFQLDRLSLQTIYFSFIRPILEYEKLDKIQNEAARIVT